jgi:two-component system, NtrC family, response regulator PilR
MQQVRALIGKVARSMAPVLVHGESGTGKELVARAIHEVSPRAAQPFVAVNCGAIPRTCSRPSSSATARAPSPVRHEDREGFFQAAQGGTLFLDEIGDLPLAMQSKLLRVIQERAVRPLGGVAEMPVNVRIVSATHKDLGGRGAGRPLPPGPVLPAQRHPHRRAAAARAPGDLPAICDTVLRRIARDAGVDPVPTLAPDVRLVAAGAKLPGNVRELENLLHRALALSAGGAIGCADLDLPGDPGALPDHAPRPCAGCDRAGASVRPSRPRRRRCPATS